MEYTKASYNTTGKDVEENSDEILLHKSEDNKECEGKYSFLILHSYRYKA